MHLSLGATLRVTEFQTGDTNYRRGLYVCAHVRFGTMNEARDTAPAVFPALLRQLADELEAMG